MLFSTGVLAESTVYIGDQVKIPMRSNDAIAKDNVINRLNINTPVTLIKKQANGWSHIKHNDQQGWMISRYLTTKKPYNKLADQLQNQLNVINQSNKDKFQHVSNLEQKNQAYESEIARLKIDILNNNAQSLEQGKFETRLFELDKTNADLNQQLSVLKVANSSLHTTDFLTIVSTVTLFLGFGVGMGISRASASRENKMYTL